MACRRRTIIAISTFAAVLLVGCGGEETKRTDAAATASATNTTAAPTRPHASVVPDAILPLPDVRAQLRDVVDEAVRTSHSIPGLVLHVEAPRRQLDLSVAAGLADRATAMPLTPDAGFRIASNNKTFTAAAILRLVEQGRVGLDDPIAHRLTPQTVDALRRGGYDTDAITIRQLLVHTSGIYDHGKDPAYEAAVNDEPAKRWTRLEQVQWAVDHGTPVGDPGAAYVYSDTGYILLGEILEQTTGAPLADAYRALLDFTGLHLDATYLESLEPAPPGVADRAHQYVGDVDGFDADPSFDLYGAAGLVSTVDDLAIFYRALLQGKVFTEPDTLATMLEIPASNTDAGAAMGIFRTEVAGNTCWSHSGFWGTFVLTCPQLDVTLAASWNQAMPGPDFDAERVLRRAFELATAPG
jgi:D-alanyl-D-alanine carboxypeptidase